MKIFAEIKGNLVTNRAKFRNDADIPDGWIDCTEILCSIGDPLDGNLLPIPKPSKYHTVLEDETGWEITSENQAIKDADTERSARGLEMHNARSTSGMRSDTVTASRKKISDIFDGIRSKPTDTEKLNALINKCELIFKKISIELLR